MKDSRWYEVKDDLLFIYDEPYKKYSRSVSIVKIQDIKYYLNAFKLSKIWG